MLVSKPGVVEIGAEGLSYGDVDFLSEVGGSGCLSDAPEALWISELAFSRPGRRGHN